MTEGTARLRIISRLLLLLGVCGRAVAPPPSPQCEPPGSVAVLLCGYVSTDPAAIESLNVHLRLIVSQVVRPYDADVHAAYETPGCTPADREDACAARLDASERLVNGVLRRELGGKLRAVAIVRNGAARRFAFAAAHSSRGPDGVTTSYALEPERAVSLRAPKLYASTLQWLKLREAWRLMEAGEAAKGSRYAVVVKLRFDVVPVASPAWRLCAARDWLRASDPPAVHAMSDLVLWGRRDAMAVAASLWAHIGYFERGSYTIENGRQGAGRPVMATRPVAVGATLRSLLSLPPQAFADWTLYQKIGHANVPDMGLLPDSRVQYKPGRAPKRLERARQGMLANLRAARDAGWEWLDPLQPRPHQPNVTAWVTCGRPGGRCTGGLDSLFNTERDLVQWLLLHNVTVCDLGAGTSAVLHKNSRIVKRQAFDGCALDG